MQLLNGKEAAEKVKLDLTVKVRFLQKNKFSIPHLAAILIGHNGASETYVASKIKSCAEIGIQSSLIRFDESVSETELLQII